MIVVTDADSDACVTDWLIQPFTPEYARTRLRAWVMRSTCRWGRAPLPEDEDSRIKALNELNILWLNENWPLPLNLDMNLTNWLGC